MKNAIIFGILVLISIFFIPEMEAASGGINCTIATSCPSGFTRLLGLQNDSGGNTNAHVENITTSAYNYSLCCEATSAQVDLSASCSQTQFLLLFAATNTHVQIPSQATYTVNACIGSSAKTPSCSYPTGSCSAQECLLSMVSSEGSNITNAHVGPCAAYSQKVCCSINNSIPTIDNALIGAHVRDPLNNHLVFDDNLVGYWKFEGNANDSSSQGNNGTIAGPVNTSQGRVGSALNFDGTDDYVTLADDNSLDFTTAMTIAAWIKLESNSANDYVVDKQNEYSLLITSQKARGLINFSTGPDISSAQTIEFNQWYHLVFTYDTSLATNNAKLYVNGIVDANASSTVEMDVNAIETRIGCFSNSGGACTSTWAFDGTIDEVMLLNRSLNETEVSFLYNETRGNRSMTNNPLGVSPLNGTDGDNENINYVYNWKVNGTPIAILNMPFDIERTTNDTGAVNDYSGNSHNGTLGDGDITDVPNWNITGIKGGAYSFDGLDDLITIADSPDWAFGSKDFTIEAWTRLNEVNDDMQIVQQKTDGSNYWEFRYGSGVSEGLQFRLVEGGSITIGLHSNWSDINEGQWNYVVLTRQGNTFSIYLNGSLYNSTVDSTTMPDFTGPLIIGSRDIGDEVQHFNGTIDEVKIYNRSLSAEQIAMIYNSGVPKYNVIVANETNRGETWSADIYGNDKTNTTPKTTSNDTIILNTPPKVTLLFPPNANTTFTNRTPQFDWTDHVDPDGDASEYRFQLALDENFATVTVNTSTGSTSNYEPTTPLDFDEYYWRVISNDTVELATSPTFNFTLIQLVSLNLSVSKTTFSGSQPGDINDTTDDSPPPLVVENIGNTPLNLSINGSRLFDSAAINLSNYQAKVDNVTGEEGAFNWQLSNTTFFNMSDNLLDFVRVLNWTSGFDEAEIDIRIQVPLDEPPGDKSSTIVISGAAS